MTLKQRIAEARGLCGDIERDLEQLEILRGASNPEDSLSYVSQIVYVTLYELREHVTALEEHYERACAKRDQAKGKAR